MSYISATSEERIFKTVFSIKGLNTVYPKILSNKGERIIFDAFRSFSRQSINFFMRCLIGTSLFASKSIAWPSMSKALFFSVYKEATQRANKQYILTVHAFQLPYLIFCRKSLEACSPDVFAS